MIQITLKGLNGAIRFKESRCKGKRWNHVQKLRAEKLVSLVYAVFLQRVHEQIEKALFMEMKA